MLLSMREVISDCDAAPVNAFGYVRNTVDMGVWIAVDADNQQRVLQAI
jgi:hypothetical protein